MHTSHSRLPGELTFMALIVLFSAFMLWASFQISRFDSLSSPGFFPMLCAATMLVTGLLSLVKAARAKLSLEPNQSVFQQFVQKLAPLTLVLFTVLIVVYMLLLEVLGSKRLGLNLAVSAVVLAAIFIVFQTAFSVVLPSGSLVGPYLPEFLK